MKSDSCLRDSLKPYQRRLHWRYEDLFLRRFIDGESPTLSACTECPTVEDVLDAIRRSLRRQLRKAKAL